MRRLRPKRTATALLCVTALLCGASGCSGSTRRPTTRQTLPKAPPLTLQLLDGSQLLVSDFLGKVVVLDFMASWCRPCEQAVPHYQQMQRERGPARLQVIFVSQDDDLEDIKRFREALQIREPLGVDRGERWYRAYGAQALPTTVIIDTAGRIVATVDGSEDENFIGKVDAVVATLLAETDTE